MREPILTLTPRLVILTGPRQMPATSCSSGICSACPPGAGCPTSPCRGTRRG